MPKDITERQKELLQFIIRQVREHNLPPSISEMASFLKVSSKNAVAKLLNALEDAGYVKTDGRARGITILDALGEALEKGMIRVPVLGRVQAGSPHLAEEQIEEWVNLPQTLVKGRRDVFLLKVRGDSMINAGIYEGDLVIVRPVKDAKNNDIVVALLRDEATVKRLIYVKDRAYLKAENPDYANIYPKEEWTIQGKVVGVIRNVEETSKQKFLRIAA
ncbi:MAG: transcriptional repressor LexA [Candidatus Doudnabacteria bacterium]|nr:transcriptional repressor LexA [Candidatus Doudnabacteria bacterium]